MPNTRSTVVSFSPTRSAYNLNSGAPPASSAFFSLSASPTSSIEPDLESLVRSITSKPRSPSSSSMNCSDLNPFWYGAEEPTQIKEIIAKYSSFLKVDADRPANSRCPKCFVGSIRRTQQTSLDAAITSPFCTVDEVCVYQLDIVPLDCPLSVVSVYHLAVTWDREDGLPLKLRNLDAHHDDSDSPLSLCSECPVYQDELDRCPDVPPTFLYSFPLYEHPSDEFLYLEDKRARPMSYFCDDVNKLCVLSSVRNPMQQSDTIEVTPWSPSQPPVPLQSTLIAAESRGSAYSDSQARPADDVIIEEKSQDLDEPEEQRQHPSCDDVPEDENEEEDDQDDVDPMDDDDDPQFILDVDDDWQAPGSHVAFATIDSDELGGFVFEFEATTAPSPPPPRAREKSRPIAMRSNGRSQPKQQTPEPLSRSFEEVQAMLASLGAPRLVGLRI